MTWKDHYIKRVQDIKTSHIFNRLISKRYQRFTAHNISFAKWAKRDFFKKAFGTFFSLLKALINCKVSEKVMNGLRKKMRKSSIFGHFGPKWPILESFWPKWPKR